MEELSVANSALDQNLPKELLGSIEFLGSAIAGQAQQENTMNGTTGQTLTSDQVRAIANEEAGRILADKASHTSIAAAIEKHMLAVTAAQAETAKAKAEVTDITAALNAAVAKEKKANDEVQKAKEADENAKKEHGEKDKAYSKAKADLEAANAELVEAKKKLAGFENKDKKEKREKDMAEAKVKSDKFKKRAVATKEDGSFEMSDEQFTVAIEELKEQAVAGETGGTPVPAPKDPPGPASKQGKSTGVPVPAPTDPKGPADKQKHAKMAHATEGAEATPPAEGNQQATEGEGTNGGTTTEQPAATEQATATATPAAPDLSMTEIYAQATAAMVAQSGPKPTAAGKSRYAEAFGA